MNGNSVCERTIRCMYAGMGELLLFVLRLCTDSRNQCAWIESLRCTTFVLAPVLLIFIAVAEANSSEDEQVSHEAYTNARAVRQTGDPWSKAWDTAICTICCDLLADVLLTCTFSCKRSRTLGQIPVV